jgi:hypothetical protein
MRKPILAVLFFLAFQLSVFAQHPDSGWIHSYTAETSDKKYIFVMRRKGGDDYLLGDKYPQSGMYLNDGSMEPLWTVDWKQRVFLPDDGKHVVRLGRLHYSASYREEVFAFFAEGNVLKTYQTRDLIDFPYLLPHSSAGYGIIYSPQDPNSTHDGVRMKVDNYNHYPLNSGAVIDNENQTLAIETCHGDKYLFDFTTGDIISAQRPSRNLALTLFGVLIAAYAVYLFFAARAELGETFSSLATCAAGLLITFFLFLIPIISIFPYKTQCDYHLPDYPDFWTCCLLSVSMLPRYLLTSLNLISPPTQDIPIVGFEAIVFWTALFWFPCFVFFSYLSKFIISFLKSKRRALL